MTTTDAQPYRPSGIRFDNGKGNHGPQLYVANGTAPYLTGLDAVDDQAVEQFREQGYLAVHDALSAEQVETAKQALSDLIREKDPSNYQLMFEGAAEAKFDELTTDEREKAVRKVFHFQGVDPRLDAICNDPKLVAIVEQFIGGPSKMFQAMALLKGPGGREKPWHQDRAYFDAAPGAAIIGVWIALDEATEENGCMYIMPGRHREPMIHFQRRDWQICDTTIEAIADQRVCVPLPPGGILFFDSLLPHGTPTNHSPQRRRALQYHYQPADMQPADKSIRTEQFGSEGKDVEC